MSDGTSKTHYIWQHSTNETNYFFKELFSPDNNSKRCDECEMEFKDCRLKKIVFFCYILIRLGTVE